MSMESLPRQHSRTNTILLFFSLPYVGVGVKNIIVIIAASIKSICSMTAAAEKSSV